MLLLGLRLLLGFEPRKNLPGKLAAFGWQRIENRPVACLQDFGNSLESCQRLRNPWRLMSCQVLPSRSPGLAQTGFGYARETVK